jgi:transcriptional regulator with GAF, ATPase, and Fis domain
VEIRIQEFFYEMTLRICSSLDINVALERSYDYLHRFFPLNELLLVYFNEEQGAIHQVAHNEDQGTEGIDDLIPLPPAVWAWTQGIEDPLIDDSANPDPMSIVIAPLVKRIGKSALVLPLRIEGRSIGLLILRANGEGRYGEEHASLVKVISEPFVIALSNALAHQKLLNKRDLLLDDNRFLQKELARGMTDRVIGESGGLKVVLEMARQVASLRNTVLLLGETGVGKEVIANAIHYGVVRNNAPFIKVNCGAIPETLVDSELFGHEKGAFTGASQSKRGRFERANGGTIFLDEIGELPLQAQVKLLRVLENRELERIGGTRSIPIDVRIIAATHQNLERMISEKRFREDLWFRINIFPITIPPLRQRKEDIPALAKYFIQKKSRQLGLSTTPALGRGALERLLNYEWPGNVRELQNFIEREIIRYRGGDLYFESLAYDNVAGGRAMTASLGLDAKEPLNLDEAMAVHIRKVLKHTQGRINGPGGAADLLGINPSTLRSRMDKLGVQRA